ncbi:hypothetical protein HHI36_021144 [Cryptolaemus montrouzieri]|uniref:Uncharacterized protein n=1 Tax=Cryptolaemus montrouzieri TaxID=559131 RepID=A0ABD2MW90_9CUCU
MKYTATNKFVRSDVGAAVTPARRRILRHIQRTMAIVAKDVRDVLPETAGDLGDVGTFTIQSRFSETQKCTNGGESGKNEGRYAPEMSQTRSVCTGMNSN